MPARSDLSSAQTRDVYYAYDLLGRVTAARFDSVTGAGVTFAYDALGRPSSSGIDMGGVTRTLAYAHDAAGNRTSLTYPDGVTATTQYDALGRAYFIHSSAACCLAYRSFLPNGAPDGISRADGSGTWINYDALQRPSSMGQTLGLFRGIAAFDYGDSLLYRPVPMARSPRWSTATAAWTNHYAVDRAYTTNGRNQQLRFAQPSALGPVRLGFGRGHLTSEGSRAYLVRPPRSRAGEVGATQDRALVPA